MCRICRLIRKTWDAPINRLSRINSQSGKGGVAYIMERKFGYKLPKASPSEFGRVIQQITDQTGDELSHMKS